LNFYIFYFSLSIFSKKKKKYLKIYIFEKYSI
jgi:hypothetical protein